MTMRNAAVSSSVFATLLATGIIAAPGAHAADVAASATCTASSTTNRALSVGDRLVISTSGLCTRLLGTDGGLGGTGTLTYVQGGTTRTYPIGTGGTPGIDVPSTVTYTATVVGGARIEIRDSGAGGVIQAWNVTVTAPPPADPAALRVGPAPTLQQFGKPASSTCDAAQPEGLNWGGAPTGGWSTSWAQWLNNGTGGAVCTRTLVYSSTRTAWVVG